VVFGIGVRPRTELAADAGLPLGESDGLRTDPSMAVPGHEGVWAAGDCVESWDRVRARYAHVPLGTHANKQGRVVGLNLTGGDDVFAGVVGTAITKVCDLEIGRTGLTEAMAEADGRDAVSGMIETTTKAGYFPGAEPMTVRLTAERGGLLLGGQIVGRSGSALRIDTIATALWAGMSVRDLVDLDLAYAPPFSSPWDPVQVAARTLLTSLR
jgi:NADPH-dependent 2,4-dienoyl-CoA reductase/sulfur reductase-like enzyme